MTDEDKNLLSILEARIRQLMFLHDELKKRNASLMQTLAAKDLELQRLQQDYRTLEASYTNLKQARIISNACPQEDIEGTKQRLSKLVREIDRCLALLNG